MAGDDLYQVVVNSVSANIAILDERGVIIETNDAWREYGRSNGMPDSYDSVGINYLSVCQVASAEEDIDAGRVAEGIRAGDAGRDRGVLHAVPLSLAGGKTLVCSPGCALPRCPGPPGDRHP